MLILAKISKLFPHVSFKLSVIILVFLFIINCILFYNLRYIGYVQNTVPILQSKQIVLEEEKKVVMNGSKNVEKTQCKISNVTETYYSKILHLKEELGEFYMKAPNSTELPKRCDQFKKTMTKNELLPAPLIDESYFNNGQLIKLLKNSTILRAYNAKKGSQLKLHLQLSGDISAIFKPKWYSYKEIIIGPVYGGKDRHYGEVVAFYLSILLNFIRVPVAAIRKLNFKELLLVSDQALLETFITKDNGTCLYGVCPYCNPSDLLCTDSNILEGSVIIYLSSNLKLKIHASPWRRTYRCDALARWETDENYCFYVRTSKFYSNERNTVLLFDLIDASIFDFLIDNGDRHHFEYIEKDEAPMVLFLDNGKSFGNPYADHIDILAPLYQCCLLRNSTWNTLLHLRGGNLSHWLRFLLNEADPDVVLEEMHFKALDRRLLIIFTVMKDCIKRKGMQNITRWNLKRHFFVQILLDSY